MKYIPDYSPVELSGVPILLIAVGATVSYAGYLTEQTWLLTVGISMMILALPLMYRSAYMQCGCYLAPRDTEDSSADVTVLSPESVDFVVARLDGRELLRFSLDTLTSVGDKPKRMRTYDYSFSARRAVTLVFSESDESIAVRLDLPKDGDLYRYLCETAKRNKAI